MVLETLCRFTLGSIALSSITLWPKTLYGFSPELKAFCRVSLGPKVFPLISEGLKDSLGSHRGLRPFPSYQLGPSQVVAEAQDCRETL